MRVRTKLYIAPKVGFQIFSETFETSGDDDTWQFLQFTYLSKK